jgi:hypothetical protein
MALSELAALSSSSIAPSLAAKRRNVAHNINIYASRNDDDDTMEERHTATARAVTDACDFV